ncbi:type II toxin-antitoxin system RelE family toxin [Algoriphagus machipongonensis]|uniref:Toxin-antitoxin system, toxin component, RelE family n=1 Tax=Algoriphagus machipongonensis TaxID=388413 RepID=A3HWQ0_9BACT|nr:hypothetical protein [Algoriphagus machipongonensis]EAZ81023.1 hypothetical protein ALPR1_18343 [Algoriphagus machipongonensis]
MKVRFLNSFLQDLDLISDQKEKEAILKVIDTCEKAKFLSQLASLKKLPGFKNVFRIKDKNYRIGLYIEINELVFARISHKAELYKMFP